MLLRHCCQWTPLEPISALVSSGISEGIPLQDISSSASLSHTLC